MSRTLHLALLAAIALSASAAWAAPKVEDRYGPAAPALAAQSPAPPPALLSWPGKSAPPRRPQAVQASPTSSPSSTQAPASKPALPANLYAPPAAASDTTPHRYSVHREFGVKPDPIPLPPQFFADSAAADMADPPPPPPAKALANQTAGAAATRNRDTAADSSQVY